MHVSICDVTLYGLMQMHNVELTANQQAELATTIDSLNVDSILLPLGNATNEEVANWKAVADSIKQAEIVLAVPSTSNWEAIREHFPSQKFALRILGETQQADLKQWLTNKPADCIRIECGIDIGSSHLPAAIANISQMEIGRLILVDGTGKLLPSQAESILNKLPQNKTDNLELGARFRHDFGVSVANSLIAAQAGLTSLDCSLLGVGPFTGYTPLEELAVTLKLHSEEYGRTTNVNTENLIAVNEAVSEIINLSIWPNKPVSGENIFATEAGIHQDGLLKNPDTYLPYRPELVGASGVKLVIGRHSGRRAVAHRLDELGHQATDEQVMHILELIKKLPKGQKVTDTVLEEMHKAV